MQSFLAVVKSMLIQIKNIQNLEDYNGHFFFSSNKAFMTNLKEHLISLGLNKI